MQWAEKNLDQRRLSCAEKQSSSRKNLGNLVVGMMYLLSTISSYINYFQELGWIRKDLEHFYPFLHVGHLHWTPLHRAQHVQESILLIRTYIYLLLINEQQQSSLSFESKETKKTRKKNVPKDYAAMPQTTDEFTDRRWGCQGEGSWLLSDRAEVQKDWSLLTSWIHFVYPFCISNDIRKWVQTCKECKLIWWLSHFCRRMGCDFMIWGAEDWST